MQISPSLSPVPLLTMRGVSMRSPAGGTALRHVDLDIRPGEFVTVLGSSGSGKSAMVRMAAGLEEPTEGEIHIEGAAMRGWPPHRRPLGVMLQDFALYPHLNVAANIGFPLRVHSIARREQRKLVSEAIEMFSLAGKERRRPHDLGVADQVRVGLARAFARTPKLVLIDAPLGALDDEDRRAVCMEIAGARRRLGAAILYATRDSAEAMAMSDRIAILADGHVLQCDTPRTLYEAPASLAVARGFGTSNALAGRIAEVDEDDDRVARIRLECGLDVEAEMARPMSVGAPCVMTVRSDRIAVAAATADDFGDGAIGALIAGMSYRGGSVRLRLSIADGAEIVADRPPEAAASLALGDRVAVAWQPFHARAFPSEAKSSASLAEIPGGAFPTGADSLKIFR